MKVFITVFLRFEQTIDYKMKFRGESTIVVDSNESGLSFSEEETKTTFYMETHPSPSFCCELRDQVL